MPPRVWVLKSDALGGDGQSFAIAEALGWSWETRRIHFTGWQAGLAKYRGRLGKPSLAGIDKVKSDKLEPPWPDLVIAAGRRQVPVERWLKAQNPGRTRIVHILRPLAPTSMFDLVICDGYPATAHSLAPQFPLMRKAKAPEQDYLARWQDKFSALPRPWICLLVGGPARPYLMPGEFGETLAREVAQTSGSLLISTSRRTPPQVAAGLDRARPSNSYFHSFVSGAADNPFTAMLHLADRVVVTSDSVSMAVEAIRAGRPTQIFRLPQQPLGWQRLNPERLLYRDVYRARETGLSRFAERLRRLGVIDLPDHLRVFMDKLVARGSASYFGEGEPRDPQPLPDELGEIATRIRAWFPEA